MTASFFGVSVWLVKAPWRTGMASPSPTNDPAIVGVRWRLGMMILPDAPKLSDIPLAESRVMIAAGISNGIRSVYVGRTNSAAHPVTVVIAGADAARMTRSQITFISSPPYSGNVAAIRSRVSSRGRFHDLLQ